MSREKKFDEINVEVEKDLATDCAHGVRESEWLKIMLRL